MLGMPQLYVVALLAGTLTLFFGVADNAFLPSVVRRKELVEANSKFGLSDSTAEITAPAITGSLVQIISAPLTILIDALSYLFSALLLGAIRVPETSSPGDAPRHRMSHEILTGLKLVAYDRILRATAAASAMFTFFGSFFGALYALYVLRVVGLSPAMLGVLVSAGGVGALLGALIAGRLLRRFGLGPTLVGAFFTMGLMAFWAPLAAGQKLAVVMLMAGQLLGDMALAVYMINEVSLRQAITPNHLLGRMNASFAFFVTGLSPLGLLLGGFLGEVLGIRNALFVAATGISLGGLWLIFSPVVHLRDYPETEEVV
jgi:predicted MFS family arabinose efflux permease